MIPVLAAEALGQIATAVFSGGSGKSSAGQFHVPQRAGGGSVGPGTLGRLANKTHGALLGLQETAPGSAIQADDLASTPVRTG